MRIVHNLKVMYLGPADDWLKCYMKTQRSISGLFYHSFKTHSCRKKLHTHRPTLRNE